MKRVLSVALSAWASTGAVAGAAEVRADGACYREGAPVALDASGFAPDAVFTALLDGVALGGGQVEQSGSVEATFPAPALPAGVRERRHDVGVLDARGNAAATPFLVSRPAAAISPVPRDARTARVRFRVYGMGTGPVTLRWIDPAGRVVWRAALGPAAAPCGRLISARRRLFPFTPRPGLWRLRFTGPQAQVVLRLRVRR